LLSVPANTLITRISFFFLFLYFANKEFATYNLLEKFQNIPAFKSALLLAIGILIGSSFQISHLTILIILLLLLVASALYLGVNRNYVIKYVLPGAVIIAFGIFRGGLDQYVLPDNSIAHIPDTPAKSRYKLSGIINEIPDYDSTRIRFKVIAKSLITHKDTISVSGEIIITVFKDRKDDVKPPSLKAGDEIEITGSLVTPWGKRNPGEFDYRKYLETQDIYKSFLVNGYENSKVISSGNLGFIEQKLVFPAKYFATETIEKNMSGDEAEYLKGLVTGQRNDISAETKDAFIKTGVMHLIAVSGLNVAYLIIIIVTLLSIFRVYFRWKTGLVIAALIFYCLFTGSSPSIVRATIMGILLLLTYDMERKVNFYNAVGFSAFVILIFNTKQLFDPGFILSYTAVLSMVFCYEKFKPYLVEWYEGKGMWYRRWIKYALILFVTTLAAQVGVLPVTGNYFEKISIVSLPANLIIVPLANLSLAVGFMQVLAETFSGYLSSVIAAANTLILSFQLWLIKLFSSWDFTYFEVFKFDELAIAAYFICLILLLTMSRKNYRFRVAIAILIICGIIVHYIQPDNELKVSFLDTGAGECSIIKTPDEKVILVNCGIKTQTYDSGERTIAPYLKRNGINKIDLIILTEESSSQIGGLEYIQSAFPIGKIISTSTTKEGDFIDAFDDLRIYFLSEGIVKILYKDLVMVYASNITHNDGKYLKSKYGNFVEADILAGNDIASDVFHPQVIITSNSKNSRKFIELAEISRPGTKLHSTNKEGAFILKSTGGNIRVVEWR
jgi:competence protein ComEC